MKILDKVRQLPTKLSLLALGSMATVHAWAATAESYNVKDIVAEFDKGEAPVGAVASASLELLVIRRVWKIIRSSI